jgi:hypothetical protein
MAAVNTEVVCTANQHKHTTHKKKINSVTRYKHATKGHTTMAMWQLGN